MSLVLEPMGEVPVAFLTRNNGFDFSKKKNLVFVSTNRVVYSLGRSLVFASFDSEGNMYEDGEVLYGLENGGIGDFTVSHDFKHIAVAERSRNRKPNIFVYSIDGLKKVSTLVRGTERGYASVSFNKFRPELLVSLGQAPDYMLSVWDWPQEKILLKFKAFSQEVYNVEWSPNIPGHLTTSGMGHIRFWKMASTFTGLKLQGDLGKFDQTELSDIISFCELPDGKIVSSTEYGKLLLWEGVFVKAELVDGRGLPGHEGRISCVFTDPCDEGLIVSVGEDDGWLRWWLRSEIDLAEATEESAEVQITCVKEARIPGDRPRITHVAPEPGRPHVWKLVDARNGSVLSVDTQSVPELGQALPGSTAEGTGVIACREVFRKPAGHMVGASSVRLVDGATIVANSDGSLSLVDTAGGTEQEVSRRKWSHAVTCVRKSTIDPQGRTVVCGFADGTVRELTTDGSQFVLLSAFKAHPVAVKHLAVTPSGKSVCSIDEDGAVFVFERPAYSQQVQDLLLRARAGENVDLTRVFPALKPVGFFNAPGVVTADAEAAKDEAVAETTTTPAAEGEEKEQDDLEESLADDSGRVRPKMLLGPVTGLAAPTDGLIVITLESGVVAEIDRPLLGAHDTSASFKLEPPCRLARLALPTRPADRDIAAEVEQRNHRVDPDDEEEAAPAYETPFDREQRLRRNQKKAQKKAMEAELKAREAAAAAAADEEDRRLSAERLNAASRLTGAALLPLPDSDSRLVLFGSGKYSSALWSVTLQDHDFQMGVTHALQQALQAALKSGKLSAKERREVVLALCPEVTAQVVSWLPYPGESPSVTSWPEVTSVAGAVSFVPQVTTPAAEAEGDAPAPTVDVTPHVVALVGYLDSSVLAVPMDVPKLPPALPTGKSSKNVAPPPAEPQGLFSQQQGKGPVVNHCSLLLPVLRSAPVNKVTTIDVHALPAQKVKALAKAGAETRPLITVGAADGSLVSARLDVSQLFKTAAWNDAGRAPIPLSPNADLEALVVKVTQAEDALKEAKYNAELVLRYKDGEMLDDGSIFKSSGQEEQRLAQAESSLRIAIAERDFFASKIPPRDIVSVAPARPKDAKSPLAELKEIVQAAVKPSLEAQGDESTAAPVEGAASDAMTDVPEPSEDGPVVYSLEEEKLRAGEDHAQAQAAEQKVLVRVSLDKLRAELVALLEKNAQLAAKDEALQAEQLVVDVESAHAARQRGEERKQQTLRELARAKERAEVQMRKAHGFFTGDVEQEEFSVRGLRRRDVQAATLRTTKLSDEVNREIVEVYKTTREYAANGNDNAEGDAQGANPLSETQVALSLGLNNPDAGKAINKASRASARHARATAIAAAEQNRPPLHETEEDKAAMEEARNTFGLFDLKLEAGGQKLPTIMELQRKLQELERQAEAELRAKNKAEGRTDAKGEGRAPTKVEVKMLVMPAAKLAAMKACSVASHRVRLALLSEALFTTREEFNSRVKHLRESKASVLAFLAKAAASLRQLAHLLMTTAPLPADHPALDESFGASPIAKQLALEAAAAHEKTLGRAVHPAVARERATRVPLRDSTHPEFLSVLNEVGSILASANSDFLIEHPERRLFVDDQDVDAHITSNGKAPTRHARLEAQEAQRKNLPVQARPDEVYVPLEGSAEAFAKQSGKLVGPLLNSLLSLEQQVVSQLPTVSANAPAPAAKAAQAQVVATLRNGVGALGSSGSLAMVVSRSTVQSRRHFVKEVRARAVEATAAASAPSGKGAERAQLERRVRLLVEKQALERRIHEEIEAFDAQCWSLDLQRTQVQAEVLAGEIELLTLKEELSLLEGMDDKEKELQRRLAECKTEELEVKTRLTAYQEDLSKKEERIAKKKADLEDIKRDYREVVQDIANQSILSQLERIFTAKPVNKSNRGRGGAHDKDEEEEEEEEIQEEDEDGSDYDSDSSSSSDESSEEEEEEEEVDDSCPDQCDMAIHEAVLDFRGKVWKILAELEGMQKKLQDEEKVFSEESRLLAEIAHRKKNLDLEAQLFQLAKLRRLNRVVLSVQLTASRIFNLEVSTEAFKDRPVNSAFASDDEDGPAGTSTPGCLPVDLTKATLMTRAALTRLKDREAALLAEAQEKAAIRQTRRQALRALTSTGKELQGRLVEWERQLKELYLLRFGKENIDLDLLERSEPSAKAQELKTHLEEREAQTAVEIREAEQHLKLLKLQHARATQENTELLSAIAKLGHSQMELDAALAAQLHKVRVADNGPTDRMAAAHRQRLEQILSVQVKEIATLQGEINLFRRKGGHIYSTVTGPQL